MCVPMPHSLTGPQRAPTCAMCVKCVSPVCANYKSYKSLIHIHFVKCVSCVSGFLFCGWYIHMVFYEYQGVFTMILEKTENQRKSRHTWHTVDFTKKKLAHMRHTLRHTAPN